MTKYLAAGCGLAALFGLAQAAAAQGVSRYDGQYVGELTLVRIISGDCTQPPLGSQYPLTIAGGVVQFKYVPRFDTTLRGTIDATGSFKATRQLKNGLVSMSGHVQGGNVTANLVSPSCNYTFQTRN